MWFNLQQLDSLAEETGLRDLSDPAGDRTTLALGPIQVDGYTIVREVGRGGMGVVYEAQQETPYRRVALKILDASNLTPRRIRWFRREVRALGRLEHPGIARIYATGSFDRGELACPYIAMEYVDGEPLLTAAATHELDVRARVELVAAIADAVQHAHTRGVIHRDLKPANLMVCRSEGGTLKPKVLDFGVARVAEGDGRVAPHAATLPTSIDSIVGTVPYMSPEQLGGDQDLLDVRTDVYALGVVLYQLLAGRLPHVFANHHLSEAARVIRDEEPMTLESCVPALSGDLNTIVMKAIARRVDDRYDAASDLAAELRRFLAHQPIEARPPSPMYLALRFVQRNRGLVFTIATAVVLLIAAATMTFRSGMSARRDALQALAQADASMELLDELTVLAGAISVRRSLAQVTEAYYRDRRQREPDNEALLSNHVKAMEHLGDVAELTDDRDEAIRWYDEAIAIRRTLVDAFPHEPGLQAALSICLVRRGDVAKKGMAIAAALPWYQEAMGIDQSLVEAFPAHAGLADNLTYSYERMAAIMLSGVRWDDAAELMHRRHALSQRLLDEDPQNPLRRLGVVNSRLQLAGLAWRREDYAQALIDLAPALPIIDELVDEAPHNPLYRDKAGGILRAMAAQHVGLQQWNEAQVWAKRAVDSRIRLVEMAPHSRAYQAALASAMELEIEAAHGMDLHREAAELFDRTLAIRRGLADGPAASRPSMLALLGVLTRQHVLMPELAGGDHDPLHEAMAIVRTIVERNLATPGDYRLAAKIAAILDDPDSAAIRSWVALALEGEHEAGPWSAQVEAILLAREGLRDDARFLLKTTGAEPEGSWFFDQRIERLRRELDEAE